MAARARRRSARNRSGPSSYTSSCPYPWQAISCPRAAISRTRSGCRSASQPSTKKVARFSVASAASSRRRVDSRTREGRLSQRDRSIRFAKFETWKYSSRSMLRALSVKSDAVQQDHRLRGIPQDQQVHHERAMFHVVEIEGQLLLEAIHVVHIAVTDLRPAREPRLERAAQSEIRIALADRIDELGPLGPRTHQAHVADEHVPELG